MGSGVKFDVIEFLKLAPKYFLPFLLFSTIIIFIPNSWLAYLNLDTIVEEYRWVVSLVFIFSLSMFLAGIILKFYDLLINRIKARRMNKFMIKKLKNLSGAQKRILLNFIENDVKSISLPFTSGEVIDLVNHSIIYRASQLSNDISEEGYLFDYCLYPNAEKIIIKNLRLLKSGR